MVSTLRIITRPVVWLPVLFLIAGAISFYLLRSTPATDPLPQDLANTQQLELILADYAQQLDSYEVALQTGNGPALARSADFLIIQRQEFVRHLEQFLVNVKQTNQPLVAQLQALAPDERFQFTYTRLTQGQLIQVSVVESELDIRHLALWQSESHVVILNDYELEWQAQVNALRIVKVEKTPFLIVNGQTQQLEDTAPFIKVFRQEGTRFKDVSPSYIPEAMYSAFGTSEFIGNTPNLKLDTLLLDPERIMAACDSCGLVGQRSLWQWGPQGYRNVSSQVLNVPDNALYGALVALMRKDRAPQWTRPFLSAPLQKQLTQIQIDPERYPLNERGLVLLFTDAMGKGFRYTMDGPVSLTVEVQKNAKGQWQALGFKALEIHPPNASRLSSTPKGG